MKLIFDLNKLKTILNGNIKKSFPSVKYSFAYGSAVIPQRGHIGTMIDVVFVVENLERFHSENKIMNKHHYSSLAYNMDLKSLLKFNNFGTCVMYNPFIVIGKDDEIQLIKYGVVSEDNFKNLLSNWDNLFIAGRFHKPVLSLESDALVEKIILENRGAAFALTYLKNSEHIVNDKKDFYADLAKLSYIGDIRTYMKAEKKDKIQNVVLGAVEEYNKIYDPFFNKYHIANNANKLELLYDILPSKFIRSIQLNSNIFLPDHEFKSIFLYKLNHEGRRRLIDNYLKKLNLKFSIYGIFSGLISTDIDKSVK